VVGVAGRAAARRTFDGMAERVCTERTPRTVAVERLSPGDHACLGFTGPGDRWALRAAFTTAGLARGERVMLFGPDGGAGLERLSSYGVPARRAAADGRLAVVADSPGWDPVRGFDAAARAGYWVAATDEALSGGFTGLRVAGDMGWVCEGDVAGGELLAYERELTPLFARIGFTALCEYDRGLFPPPLLEQAVAAHPLAVLESPGALHAERTGDALRLAGDADLATRAAFEWAVADSGLSVIDLTGLAFIDASCVRALLGLRGGVVLECTPAQLRLLLLCGLRQAEGVLVNVR
jgi:hypothetical protein